MASSLPPDAGSRGLPHPSSSTARQAPAGAGAEGGPPEKKRRILQACIVCSAKRVKCDGQRPCATCVRNGDSCGYSIPKKRGPPKGSTRAPRKSQQDSSSNRTSAGASKAATGGVSDAASTKLIPVRAAAADPGYQYTRRTTGGTGPTLPNPPSLSTGAQQPFQYPPTGPSTSASTSYPPPSYGHHQQRHVQDWTPSGPDDSALHPHPHSRATTASTKMSTNSNNAVSSSSFVPVLQPLPYDGYDGGGPQRQPLHAQSQPPSHTSTSASYPSASAREPQSSWYPAQSSSQDAPPPPPPPPPSLGPQGAVPITTGAAPSAGAPRSAYPSSLEASSHMHLPLPRHQQPISSGSIPPLALGDESNASVSSSVPAAVPRPTLGLVGGTIPATTAQHAPLSLSAHTRSSMSLQGSNTSSPAMSGGGGIGGGPFPARSNASGSGLGSTSSRATSSRATASGVNGASGLDTGVDTPSRFFRGGTSGLYGLTTQLRDRDRHGHVHEGAGGVILRTYSSDTRTDIDDLGEDDPRAGVYGGGSGDMSDRDDGTLRDAMESSGDSFSADGPSRRTSLAQPASHRGSVAQYAHVQQPSHAYGFDGSPLHSPPHGPTKHVHPAPPPPSNAGSTQYPSLFGRTRSDADTAGTKPNAGAGAGQADVPSQPVAASGGNKYAGGMSWSSSAGPPSTPSNLFSQRRGDAGLAVHVNRKVDTGNGPASASALEDDPRMHEMMWKATTSVAQRAGAPASANRPVISALNEASQPIHDVPTSAHAEDLDDLEVAVGDVTAPDFTSPLVPPEVEQKLLHLWIANINTHWSPVAPPSKEDIEAQPFLPKSSSEQDRKEAKVAQVLAAWRAILRPERRPLLWNSILSMAADAWGGDLTEAGYPSQAASSKTLVLKSPTDDTASAEVSGPGVADSVQPSGDPAWTTQAGRPAINTRLMGKVRTGRQLSTALFIRAKFFLQRTNQDASLEAIQASVFMALRESGAGRASQAAHYTTNACRMALDLGLHRHEAVKRAMGPAFTRYEDENRRRTMHCVCILDKIIAFILGRPAVLRYAEVDCPFPSEDFGDEDMPWVLMAERFISPAVRDRMQGVPSMVASTATSSSRLACIGEKIIEQYNIVKPTDWQRWVKSIHNQLLEWYKMLKPAMLDQNKHLPHAMNHLMWYNTLRILLHRPHILKEATDPDMPSSHAECTDAVAQICQLLSTYESFYNVRKVSTSLAFILFTSVTIALSNTTSNDPVVVTEAKQRLRELMRWFKKASENYRAARHHLAIINVLAEGIEIGTGGPVQHEDSGGAENVRRDSIAGVDDPFAAQAPPLGGSIAAPPADEGAYRAVGMGGAGAMNVNATATSSMSAPATGPAAAVTTTSGAPVTTARDEPAQQPEPYNGPTTVNFTGFVHSGENYHLPAETLAAAQAAWRGDFAGLARAVPQGAGVWPQLPAGASTTTTTTTTTTATGGKVLGGGEVGGGGCPAVPQQGPPANPLDFLDSQAYLNLQSEAFWGAMPVSSENLLLWNTFHNEYLSALAACTLDAGALSSTSAVAPVHGSTANASTNSNDTVAASGLVGPGVGTGANANAHGAGASGINAAGALAAALPMAPGIYTVFQAAGQ